MNTFEPLERRVLACAWAPAADAAHDDAAHAPAEPPPAAAAITAGETPAYNTPFLTDAQLEHHASMSAAEIRAFLASRGSYFRQSVPDSDGVSFDPAAAIANAAAASRINPKVLLATLQKEHSGVTRTTRPTDSQMAFLMGCASPTTARQQFACAAERFRSYHDSLARTGSTISGWRVGVSKTTQDAVAVTPATRAVAGQFTYTPYAGTQWGGNRPTVGGVYLFYNSWNVFGFADSVRPTATSSPPPYVAHGAPDLTFTVTYADSAGVDASDVVNNHAAVRVTGPNGFSRLATFVSINSSADGSPRTATYRLAAPGGAWDAADAGAYSIRVEEAQISDTNNNFVAPAIVGSLAVVPPARITGRYAFYNQSAFDGYAAQVDTRDDAALAPGKTALLPGQPATFANVTSFSAGLTGISVDLLGPAPTLGPTDFAFRSGNTPTPASWTTSPPPTAITLRPGVGVAGATRVSITFPRGLLLNTWLQITVRANNNTRLPTPDVFYFGNLAGDTGGPALTVDTLDIARTRSAMPTPAATIDSLYDHNRDGRVNSIDLATTRVHQTAGLAALGHPAPPAAAASTAGLVAVSVAPTDRRKSPDRMAAYVL